MSCTVKFRTRSFSAAALVAGMLAASAAMGQVRINEVVREVRATPSTATIPLVGPPAISEGDAGREFIELYNASASPVDISGWGILYTTLSNNSQNGYVLSGDPNSGTHIIPAHGYFVIHRDVDTFTLPGGVGVATVTGAAANGELFPDAASVSAAAGLSIALVSNPSAPSTSVEDAVAFETYATATVTAATKLATLTSNGQDAITGGGYWGTAITNIHHQPTTIPNGYDANDYNANYESYSFSRWQDGVSTNSNGRDFGFLPVTPGESNSGAPSAAHAVPDAEAVTAIYSPDYLYAWMGARAINPTISSKYNPSPAATLSPQGGKAFVAWDHTGGGNAVYSKDIVRSFDIDVYIDGSDLGHELGDWEAEHSVYGIGTTDAWFNAPNPLGTITSGAPLTRTANGSTGIGWLYERHQTATGVFTNTLALIDFGDGGESINDWDVLEEITITETNDGWQRLSISYDETTGEVTAIYGEDTFTHTIATDLYGQFYIGYREALTDHTGISAPPIFDMRAPAVEDADFDGDGDVDGADFLTWQRNVEIDDGSANLADGDANGDGDVNGEDLVIWKGQHPAATAASAPVPEPATWAMALVAGIACLAVAAPRRRAALALASK